MHIPGISPDNEVHPPRRVELSEDERRLLISMIDRQLEWLPKDFSRAAVLESIKERLKKAESKRLCRVKECDESESWMWVDESGRAWPVV